MAAPPKFLAVILLICVTAEIVWSWRHSRGVYNLRESMSNLAMMVVNRMLKPVAAAWGFVVLSLFEPLQVFRIPETAWGIVTSFIVVDFAYYWYHRFSHEVPAMWAMHHTHHSSPWMNFSTALRLNWVAKFVSPLFFAPLVLVGVPPATLVASLVIGLLYQFFLHTESIGRLGWFEGKLLNTPSAHRVHHGSNEEYIDKNYAGVFIVWDRLFGTYEPEIKPVRYGVTTGFLGHNPLTAQFQPLLSYFGGQWRLEKDHVRHGEHSMNTLKSKTHLRPTIVSIAALLALITSLGLSRTSTAEPARAASAPSLSVESMPGYSGVWRNVTSKDEEKARHEAIKKVTEDVPFFARGKVRDRLGERTKPAKQLTLKVSGDQVELSGQGAPLMLRLNAKPIEIKRNGKQGRVSAQLKGQQIVIVSEGEKGKRIATYSLSTDQRRLTVSVQMLNDKLAGALGYRSTYTRE